MDRLLDTDILIDLLRGRPASRVWLEALPEAPGICGLAAMELFQGCRDGAETRNVVRLLSSFTIVWPSEADQQRALHDFPTLHLRDATGLLDTLIAQTAIGQNLTLCTFNVRHFRAIPNLRTETPYVR